MERIASFLDLPWDDCLLAQTILGLPAEPNSSFHRIARTAFAPRSLKERFWLTGASLGHAVLARAWNLKQRSE
jgi:hypothetical protein